MGIKMEDLIMGNLVKTNGALFPSVPSFFDDFFTKEFFKSPSINRREETLPMVNISESDKEYQLEVAAPGMSKDDFTVDLDGNLLVINAQRSKHVEDKGDNYMRKEFNYQEFQRSFRLPEDAIDESRVSANYKDGILRITIPKKENSKNSSRRIKIS